MPLKQCSSSEGYSCNTQLLIPVTCGPVLPWPEFKKGSRAVFDRLDNSRHIYSRPESAGLLGAQREAAESEVRGHLSRFTESVNDTAEALGIPVRCCGGGDGRGISHAQMLMRPAGARSSLAKMSKEILGTVVITCSSQLQLKRGERLEDALQDSRRSEAIMALLQQVGVRRCIEQAPVQT